MELQFYSYHISTFSIRMLLQPHCGYKAHDKNLVFFRWNNFLTPSRYLSKVSRYLLIGLFETNASFATEKEQLDFVRRSNCLYRFYLPQVSSLSLTSGEILA